MKEVENNIITLADMKPGDQAEIIGYQGGDQRYKSKLLAMGLVRGVVLELLQIAPLGDPLKVKVLSYRLSLRKKEAEILKLRRVL
ncbi:MAG: ferrous iron transport protein A [Fibrobacter sp.]|jgi:ferrous iron transport protein A|nr:ferrous iron transport protein A [Fibrobacter sp.]HQB64481.1 FeoA family protein [Fibrobacteraceae bacterium]